VEEMPEDRKNRYRAGEGRKNKLLMTAGAGGVEQGGRDTQREETRYKNRRKEM